MLEFTSFAFAFAGQISNWIKVNNVRLMAIIPNKIFVRDSLVTRPDRGIKKTLGATVLHDKLIFSLRSFCYNSALA